MPSPLPSGTVLQNRYRVIKLLGQGGFGRTYLAEDQGRFNEQCAIKEFVPRQGEDHFSVKATELFQREAAILYQIQHPQIPQFRATFEVEQRLFLVQDYVEGTNYRDLLNQRRGQGALFTEAEVRQFLQQMLPLLAHIHAKGIIHRDISPDNIILRTRDRLPVLIDFGVVKEVVTRIQLNETAVPATTVGKVGYAPSEQMQSGRAYPNSDLYALAVTAVVLLTGREPQDLFDDVNLTWHWQRYATVSPGLAQVLNKALSYRPGDRFQSVSEMAQALGSGAIAPPVTAPVNFPQTPQPSSPQSAAASPPPFPNADYGRRSVLSSHHGGGSRGAGDPLCAAGADGRGWLSVGKPLGSWGYGHWLGDRGRDWRLGGRQCSQPPARGHHTAFPNDDVGPRYGESHADSHTHDSPNGRARGI
jgi:serine/threonine protein kinase